MSEEMKKETMDDFAKELEASYKEYEERRKATYVEEEDPNAETWKNVKQIQLDKGTLNVKIKEIVKGGAVAYVDELRGFIPASQLSLEYVEKLEDWVGKHLDVRVITADPESNKLVLSAKEVLKEQADAMKAEKFAKLQAGMVVTGVVDSIKPYGAFINLENGLSGLLHISQISSQRIKHPGVVLKEGQEVTVKILSAADGKISLSIKELQAEEEPQEEAFDYKEEGEAMTGLGALLKNIKL